MNHLHIGVQVESQSNIINPVNTGNQEFRLVITDGNGRIINCSVMQRQAGISLAGRPRGIYFVNIHDENNRIVHTQKVVN